MVRGDCGAALQAFAVLTMVGVQAVGALDAISLHQNLLRGGTFEAFDSEASDETWRSSIEVEDNTEQMPTEWQVGDHVLMEFIDGIDRGSWVKGSVTGKGQDEGTYNVHLWFGPMRRRERANVPVELLRNANSLEQREAAEKKALEEAERQRAMEALRRQFEAEAQRIAKEEADQKEAIRKAAEEAALKAAEESEAKRRSQDEERKKFEEEAALRHQMELEAQAKVEALAKRKAMLKAKWEAVKAAKLKASDEESALATLQPREVMNARLKTQLRASLKSKGQANQQTYNTARVAFRVRDARGMEAIFHLRRKMPLKVMMVVACERLGLDKTKASFYHKGAKVEPTDTVGRLGVKTNDILQVRGPFRKEAVQKKI